MGSSSKDAAAGRTRLDARDDTMVDVGDGDAPSLTRRAAVEDDDAWVATRRLIRGVARFIRSSRLSAGNNARNDRRRGRRRESGAHHGARRRFQTRARVLHLPRAVVAVDRRRCDGPQKLVAGNNRNQTTERGRGVS